MKIYTVIFHDPDGDSYVIGAFSTMDLAEQESKIFMQAYDCKEIDRDKGAEELRIYYVGADDEPFGTIDISTLTLDEFTY